MTEDDDIQPCPYCGAPVEQFSPGGKWHYACDCHELAAWVSKGMWREVSDVVVYLRTKLEKKKDERNAAYRALVWWRSGGEYPVDDAQLDGAVAAALAFVESERDSEKETKE